MFDNIGKKIKGLAKAVFWIGVVFSVALGIGLVAILHSGYNHSGGGFLWALIIIGVGGFFAWLGSVFVFGFGELIDTNQQIAQRLGAPVQSTGTPSFRWPVGRSVMPTGDRNMHPATNPAPAQPWDSSPDGFNDLPEL